MQIVIEHFIYGHVQRVGHPQLVGSSDQQRPDGGINNKIKTLLRQAYGYRDERFFILKLLGLHEANFRLSGC